ncbi:hypothetical protein HU200_055941 [Digitaria exilis]|uniref:Uncharacterized protein n=1 Tax=Digitaria exilis TaxID=1010633 RepID=A0A835AE49_9POAL|nr:hypothetical protein HU200_055941 [Digitaria exilis]CAB3475810.1 unnamed protein product [Digitaria exilis]
MDNEEGDVRTRAAALLKRLEKTTPEERTAALKFLTAALEAAKQYNAMEEEEVEEEYRRAGRLHAYDIDTEWKKRLARVARIYPPPKYMAKNIDGFMEILEEDEQDHPIGLASCVGIFEESYLDA